MLDLFMRCLFAATFFAPIHCFSADSTWVPGQQWTQQIQADYQQGKYASFLKKVDDTFQAADKQGTWKSIRDGEQTRDATTAAEYNTPAGKKRYDEIAAKVDSYVKAVSALKKERDAALQLIAAKYPDAPISTLIKARYAIPPLSTDQLKAFDTVDAWLSPFPLNSNPLIPRLRAIDLDYRIKNMLLDRGLLPDSKTPDKEMLARYKLVLTMDKYNALLQAAKQANQNEFIGPLNTVASNYPIIFAEERDGLAIEHLSQMPLDEASTQAADIIKSYKNKQIELKRQFGL